MFRAFIPGEAESAKLHCIHMEEIENEDETKTFRAIPSSGLIRKLKHLGIAFGFGDFGKGVFWVMHFVGSLSFGYRQFSRC
jgi:hypothetical protein